MNIAGVGVVCARGRGVAALRAALEQGWQPPREIEAPFLQGAQYPVYDVEAPVLADKTVLAKLRRASHFDKMATLAAWDALQDSGVQPADPVSIGVIMSTAFGPHATTFSFLDGILDFGEAGVSPTAFSHSVHNAAASYIAQTAEIRGPTVTLTQFYFSFHEALRLADAWLQEGRCRYVLAGAVDELGTVMEYAVGQIGRIAADRKIRPFQCSAQPVTVPGEGAAFLLLTRDPSARRYGTVARVDSGVGMPGDGRADLELLDADGLAVDETVYGGAVRWDQPVASYAPLFGGMMTGSAFHCAAAALMLQEQVRFASPVPDNPRGLAVCTQTGPAVLRRIRCLKFNCRGGWATVGLER